jgi:hypothetical protein
LRLRFCNLPYYGAGDMGHFIPHGLFYSLQGPTWVILFFFPIFFGATGSFVYGALYLLFGFSDFFATKHPPTALEIISLSNWLLLNTCFWFAFVEGAWEALQSIKSKAEIFS